MFLFILNEVGVGLYGVTLFYGIGALPQADFDLLDDSSYLVMLRVTLGDLMLQLLDNLVYFYRDGRTSWFDRSYYFHSKCSFPLLQLFYTRNSWRGGMAVPHGLVVPRKSFQKN
jgi:hypothetical protein